MNEAIIRDAFEELKYGYAKNRMVSLYDNIYQEVCDMDLCQFFGQTWILYGFS